MTSIFWSVVVAIMLHGEPGAVCKMLDRNGTQLATAIAWPSAYDQGVGLAHFELDPRQRPDEMHFDCQPIIMP